MSDAAARHMAVDTDHSIIVQAPAGSGKTSLLVERYLGLLALVEAPEEILAITFTRKAAAEMRQRILRCLDPDFSSDQPYEQSLLSKARRVQEKVAKWQLLEHPQRLGIRTIDSFNGHLVRAMPIVSSRGTVLRPTQSPQAVYRGAVRRILSLIDTKDRLAADVREVLAWCDHRSQDVEEMLVGLTASRDQWLRAFNVTGPPQRVRQEAVLAALVTRYLRQAAELMNRVFEQKGIDSVEVVELLRHAAANLEGSGSIGRFLEDHRMPRPIPDDLLLWQALGEALLTQDGAFRKKINKNTGFLPKTEEKDRFETLLSALEQHESLSEVLHQVRALPEPHYTDGEWAVLESTCRILSRVASELDTIFAISGRTDFTGLAEAALRGLGDSANGYTDLSLHLEWPIRHLLVDEFQDTSWSQLNLLEKLTADWCSKDGQTLFLVGDPMQSIYRFREAEVGLFIRTRDRGIGSLSLKFAGLSSNFRSDSEIVRWVNECLGPLFPKEEDIAAGAVAYAPSTPATNTGGLVRTLAYPTEAAEAKALVALLRQDLAKNADDSDYKAAIIVRARDHLRAILPELKRNGVIYRAVNLDPLLSKPVVQDLLALTRAIIQPGNITALLSLLRAPFCGLTLAELHIVAGEGRSPLDDGALNRLEDKARSRAARIFEMLSDVRGERCKRSVRDLVEGAWYRVGGPWCCRDPDSDLRAAMAFLDVLQQAEADGLLNDWNEFENILAREYTEGDPPSDNIGVEVLTMHSAKGLEYDLVLLPALNRKMKSNDRGLLHWLPFTTDSGDEQVILAPLRSAEQQHNAPLMELISNEQKTRDSYENLRLLYVAATRAKKQLVLSACLDCKTEEVKPVKNSLLFYLWPSLAQEFIASLGQDHVQGEVPLSTLEKKTEVYDQRLRRIGDDWDPPVAERFVWTHPLPARKNEPSSVGNQIRVSDRVGGVILHRLLEYVARFGLSGMNDQKRQDVVARIPALVRAAGMLPEHRDEAVDRIAAAMNNTLDSEVGRWILSDDHPESDNELAIAGILDGELVRAVVDRTFVTQDGVRWIIDYKSGYAAGDNVEQFIAGERDRYTEQLERYWRLFTQIESRVIKTALYLPLHDRLEKVTF